MMRHPVPDFYYPRRCRDKTPRVLRYLRTLRERVEAMTDDERQVNLLKEWIPTLADIDYLLNPELRQRDRVEAVILFHKRDMKGDTPSWSLIGRVLGMSKQSALRFGRELVEQGRAMREAGHFMLMDGQYIHPKLMQNFLS